jgi:hypothetical protein
MEEEKKVSIFSKMFKLFWIILLYLIPSFRVLSFNKLLKRCYKITEEKWFSNQIKRDYIIALLLFVPIIIGAYKINKTYSKDINFHNRVKVASDVDNFFDRMDSYYYTVASSEKDNKEAKLNKIETKIRLTAIGIILIINIIIQIIFAVLVIHFHPLRVKTDILTKLIVSNGIIRKEDLDKSIVFATPIGFLITITGSSAKEVAYMDRIWAGLNIRIKDWIEDDKERSVVFFRKAFELQPTYMYNEFPK